MSYLLNAADVNETSTMDSFESTGEASIPAMFGSWICSVPMEINMRMATTCARLLPKDNTPEDPAYINGEGVIVATYLTSRLTGRTVSPTPLNNNLGILFESRGFEAFDVVMDTAMDMGIFAEGAMAGFTGSMAALAAAVVALNF